MSLPSGDRLEAEALLTERYLESLLAANDRHAQDVPSDPAVSNDRRYAATRLRSNLNRVHPSFRFEERLAARLAEIAAGLRLASAAGGEGDPTPFPGLGYDPAEERDEDREPNADHDGHGLHPSRPLLIGGALTSAALSIAGAAYVAWRRTRTQSSPMARAVRAANENRALRGAAAAVSRRSLD